MRSCGGQTGVPAALPATAPAMHHAVIHLHPRAPVKPAEGAACNGCGVCCAWQPCPLGVLASRRLQGACTALRWDDALGLYRCALVQDPATVWPGLPRLLHAPLAHLARRWIAAGAGCDCSADTTQG
jgi:hypothetical protein